MSGVYASSLVDPASEELRASGTVLHAEVHEPRRCVVSGAGAFTSTVHLIGDLTHTTINGGESNLQDEFVTVNLQRQGTGELLSLYAQAPDTVVTLETREGGGAEWSGVATFTYTAYNVADFTPHTMDRWEGSPAYDATVIFLCG